MAINIPPPLPHYPLIQGGQLGIYIRHRGARKHDKLVSVDILPPSYENYLYAPESPQYIRPSALLIWNLLPVVSAVIKCCCTHSSQLNNRERENGEKRDICLVIFNRKHTKEEEQQMSLNRYSVKKKVVEKKIYLNNILHFISENVMAYFNSLTLNQCQRHLYVLLWFWSNENI